VLVQKAPVSYLHHTSWQVEDVDEVGRGATAMLEKDPDRHVWGLGRHYIGSNFFWYLKDPAGNFSEYYSDIDCIIDDQLWKPGVWEGAKGLYSWGPPAAAVVPRPRGPGRAHDRVTQPRLTSAFPSPPRRATDPRDHITATPGAISSTRPRRLPAQRSARERRARHPLVSARH